MDYIENVLAMGDQSNMRHWKLYYGDRARQNIVAGSSEFQESKMPEESRSWGTTKEYLRRTLELLSPGEYMIHFKPSPEEKNTKAVHMFTKPGISAIAGAEHHHPAQQFPMQMFMGYNAQIMQAEIGKVRAEFDAQLKEERHKREIDELKEKLRKRDKEKTDYAALLIKEFIPAIRPAIDMAIAKYTGQPTTKVAIASAGAVPPVKKNVTGTEEDEDELEEVSPELNAKLVELDKATYTDLVAFFGSEVDYVINMHCIAQLLKDKPDMYGTWIAPALEPYKEKLKADGIDCD